MRVVVSHRLETLIAHLAREVRGGDPFAEIEIATAGAPQAAQLQFALARTLGVSFGVSLVSLEAALARRLGELRPELQLADRTRISLALLALFSDRDALAAPELAMVRAYLDAGPGGDSRRFQLADEVAGLFVDYDRARPAVLDAWARDEDAPGGLSRSRERWQRALWRRVFDDGALSPLIRTVLATEAEALAGPALRVIGLSHLPGGVRMALAHLARSTSVTSYMLGPTREFWEDVATTREAARAEKRGREVVTDAPLALRLWGRPSRDTLHFLGEVTGHDFTLDFPETASTTTLARWQRDLVELRVNPEDAPTTDDSIVIRDVPSIRRELELIAGDIWSAMRDTPELRLTDMAVYVAGDFELYRAQLAAVFHSAFDLDYHVAAAPLAQHSRVVEAFEQLVQLPLGTFTRPEVLRSMIHPAVIAAFPDARPEVWVELADRLGIVHGGDASDHEGTYIAGDLFNWAQGSRRLALGAMMSGGTTASGQPEVVDFGGAAYRPLGLAGDEVAAASSFGLLSRSLIADARFAAERSLSLRDWARWFESLIHTYVRATSPADERARAQLLGVCSEMREQCTGQALSYKLAAALVRRNIAALTASRGQLCAEGVLVAPLESGMVVPAHTVYVVGLGDRALPRAGRASPLDARLAPAAGDLDPGERVRMAFLEVVLAARSRLRLSFVGRSPQTGDRLVPSALIAEAQSCLARGYAATDLVTRHPMREWDDPGPLPDTVALRRRSALVGARAGSTPGARRHWASLAEGAAIRSALLYAHQASENTPAEDAAVVELSLSTLKRFLESPVQAWAGYALGIFADDEGVDLERRDEPLDSDPLTRASLLREVFLDALREGADDEGLADRLREALKQEALGGRFPVGPFGDRLQRNFADVLQLWRASVPAGSPTVVGFGRAREGARIDELRHPLEIEMPGGRRAILSGLTLPRMPEVGSLVSTPSRDAGAKHRVRGFFDHVVCSAAGIVTGPGGFAVLASGRCRRYRQAEVPADAARAYLGALVHDLCSGSHDYALPCETALAAAKGPSGARAMHLASKSSSDDYGPLRPKVRELPADFEDVIERRFGLLFRTEEAE